MIINRPCFLLSLPFAVILAWPSVVVGEEPDVTRDSTDALFPQELELWKDSETQLVSGIVSAEALRARLLKPTATRSTSVHAIAKFIGDFQKAVDSSDGQANRLRHSVRAFDVSGERLLSQIRGDETISPDAFDAFDGRWFGRWDQMKVNHDWRPSVQFSPPTVIAKGQPPIASLQYAWISDGFGWNYLSSREGDPSKNYVLGMVYYFADPNYRDITGEKPHVGFADSPTRLIWITEFELYLEESFPESMTGKPDQYVITGLRHNLLGDSPSVSPDTVQATYTRDPNVRPAFQKITWKSK